MAKGGLGKGLDALLPQAESEAGESFASGGTSASLQKNGQKNEQKNNVFADQKTGGLKSADIFIPVDLLQPNPHQPRREFDEEALKDLAASVKEHGIIQPILVEQAEGGFYYIIAGERRTRAARMAGLKEVPVRIQKFSDTKKLEVALIENIQREDLNPLEEAKAYYKLMELGNLNQEETARRVGKNRSTVANALRLLKLPEHMQDALSAGTLSAGHARAVLSVNDISSRDKLFKRIIEDGISVREAEELAAEMNEGKKASAKKTAKPADKRDADYVFLEQNLIEKLGTKVSLKGNFERGSITIDYFSREDLDRLYNIFFAE
ncbi:ParB/RepB/Spo0J family partition protein [Treponema sp. OMZ 840]|uniref:ParB/RepB/Spo0J family partition protein n=1 Tax=Treponema sp. OMZ 840 TaxID=244313 RepID=UPI003D8B300F